MAESTSGGSVMPCCFSNSRNCSVASWASLLHSPLDSLLDSPLQSLLDSPLQSLLDSPLQSPARFPAASPAASPARFPAAFPAPVHAGLPSLLSPPSLLPGLPFRAQTSFSSSQTRLPMGLGPTSRYQRLPFQTTGTARNWSLETVPRSPYWTIPSQSKPGCLKADAPVGQYA